MKRSKGNRRKMVKHRRKLPKIRINWRAVLVPPALLAVLAGTFVATQAVLDRPVEKLRLEGAFRRVTPLQVEAALAPALDHGFFSTNLEQLRRLVAELDWVDEVEIARVWPDTLAVRISEHQAAARWGDTGLLNTRGELFTREARYEFPELPRLAGPAGRENQVASRYLAVRGRLAEASLGLGALTMDDRGAWQLKLKSGQQIRFGRSEIDARLERFFQVAVPALAAVMQRIEYVDMRYTNGFSVGWADDEPIRVASYAGVADGG
ncbi:MAG TPA: cell division protein FtsQ/DivIB [Gammaproteobacteria bacterium]